MSATVILQSHRTPLPYSWLETCLGSVRRWASSNCFDYQFIGDELFDRVPDLLREKTSEQTVIASDLARLVLCREHLDAGFETVVWLDADFLVFDPVRFVLPCSDCAVGREVWVQSDRHGKLRVYSKVHNAMLMFRQGNSLLDFYIDTATRLLEQNTGRMPPQFIGPKLLTALHNIAQLPVMETAAMISPLVCQDIIAGEGEALALFLQQSKMNPAGANLCISSCDRGELSQRDIQKLLDVLMTKEHPFHEI